ncbi:MAG: hydrolase TatD, partial [bacterium]
TRRTAEIVKAEGLDPDRVLIDHNTEETIKIARDTGCFCGMTVYPISKLTPERVSSIIREYGSERMIVNGSADWGVSDPLSLIKVVARLQQDGVAEADITRLVYGNAMALYGHSPNWRPDLKIEPLDPREFQR